MSLAKIWHLLHLVFQMFHVTQISLKHNFPLLCEQANKQYLCNSNTSNQLPILTNCPSAAHHCLVLRFPKVTGIIVGRSW